MILLTAYLVLIEAVAINSVSPQHNLEEIVEPKTQTNNITTTEPNTGEKRDISSTKTVFDQIENEDFLNMCGDFFLGGQKPLRLSTSANTRFICQKYKKDPYFATKFNLERKIADYSAYKPNIDSLERPGWKDLYEHGFYDNDGPFTSTWYGIDTRSTRKSFPYSVVAQTQGTDRTYFRGGKTFRIDRGHLNPSGINSNNVNRMLATLTYTNLVPQFSDLNQEAWRLAEITIRQFIQQECAPDKTYLLTGTVPSKMYLGYDDNYIDRRNDEIPNNEHPQLCKEGTLFCSTKYKVNIPAYMWTAGACHDDLGNCKTFSVLAKNDGHENAVGFYKLDSLEKFLGAKSLEIDTCWTNTDLEKSDGANNYLRNDQKDQVLRSLAQDSQISLFPGCNQVNTDFSQAFVNNFKDEGWSHFLHSYIPSYVENKRQQLLHDIKTAKQNAKGQDPQQHPDCYRGS